MATDATRARTFEGPLAGLRDDDLAAHTRDGSGAAFAVLVERHSPALRRYCRRLGVDASAIDDVLQQTFASAWTALASGTEVHAVRAWLYRIAEREAIAAAARRTDAAPLDDVSGMAEASASAS